MERKKTAGWNKFKQRHGCYRGEARWINAQKSKGAEEDKDNNNKNEHYVKERQKGDGRMDGLY